MMLSRAIEPHRLGQFNILFDGLLTGRRQQGIPPIAYATEVSAEEYLAYTTEETEKVEVYRLAEQLGGDIEAAIRQLAERRRKE